MITGESPTAGPHNVMNGIGGCGSVRLAFPVGYVLLSWCCVGWPARTELRADSVIVSCVLAVGRTASVVFDGLRGLV